MKNKILLALLLSVLSLLNLTALNRTDFAKDYTVKPGDRFLIQIVGLENREFVTAVTFTGRVILYPLTAPLEVAGKPLEEVTEQIKTELSKHLRGASIFVELAEIAPYSVHMLGAVSNPGEYATDSLLTLYYGLKLAGGLHPSASRNVSITRQNKTTEYDLQKYLLDGDISHNPLLMGGDLIVADFARDYAKLYVVTDTTNYVEYFEIDEATPLKQLLPSITRKYHQSNFSEIFLHRGNKQQAIESDEMIKAGDTVYLHPEESFIYVRGNVNLPGRFNFRSSKDPQYYLSLAGGVTRVGTAKTLHIVDRNGNQTKYNGQPLKEGDAIIVPVSLRTLLTDYLTPISAVLSVVTTIVILTR